MKKEDIKKAAQNYEDGLIYSSVSEQCDVQKAFKAGAEWRMNAVWHRCDDRSVKIEGDDDVMVLLENGKIYNYNDDWEEECCLVVMWAYMKDLLPKTED